MGNKDSLEEWYSEKDPWHYEDNIHDLKRKQILLSEIERLKPNSILDIGCGNGFITNELCASKVVGVDLSESAIRYAEIDKKPTHSYMACSIFDLPSAIGNEEFELVIITGVLYRQYIGRSNTLIYLLVDKFLRPGGHLISVHISSWHTTRFPYLLADSFSYEYRQFEHVFELYRK